MPARHIISAFSVIIIFLFCQPECFAAKKQKESPEAESRHYYESALDSYMEGDFLGALNYCHLFMHIVSQNEDAISPASQSACLRILGNVHSCFKDYGKAIRYYSEGLALSRQADDQENIAKTLCNMAMAACYMRDSVQTVELMREMEKHPTADPFYDRFLKTEIKGLYERIFGDWKKSVSYMKEAYRLAEKGKISRRLRITPLSEIFQLYEEHGYTDSALMYLDEYNTLAEQNNAVNMMVEAQRGYMRIYATIPGQLAKVKYHQDKYFTLRDSVMDTEAFLRLSEQYETEREKKAKREIETLQFKVSKLQLSLTALLIAAMITIIALLAVRNSRRLRKAYSFVYKSNRDIAASKVRVQQHTSGTELTVSANAPADAPETDEPPLQRQNEKDSCTQATEKEAPDEEREEGPDREDEDIEDQTSRQLSMQTAEAIDSLADKIAQVMESTDVWLDPDFSISALASLVGANTKYVSICINDRYDKNFRSFINEYRIRTALRRMSDTENFGNYTIGAIAESVGFRSQTNFISAFKKVTGVTPSHYLKLAKE